MDTQPYHAEVGESPSSWEQRGHYEVQSNEDLASRLHQHLHGASAEDRNKMWSSLTRDSELSESDSSPSRGFGECEEAVMVQSHGEMHRCLVKVLEIEETGTTVNLLNVFAEALKVPDPIPAESSMNLCLKRLRLPSQVPEQRAVRGLRP